MTEKMSDELLADITGRLLEETAFIFAEPTSEQLEFNDPILQASITFDGDVKGHLCIAIDTETSRMFAANLLGIEPDDDEAIEKGSAALTEILNILCGVFLERWCGRDGKWTMGIPVLEEVPVSNYSSKIEVAEFHTILEDEEENRIDVYVFK